MRLKIIACNVFQREVCLCAAQSPHVLDLEFTELGEHIHSDSLRTKLQARIDAADACAKGYDAVVICFGICGNATVGLRAGRAPLVMPRAHDCCTILLGSRAKFKEHFGSNPSTPFGSAGYMERGEYYMRTENGEATLQYGDAYAAYVAQYGEEDARYIWETMHPRETTGDARAVFIDIPETSHLGYMEQFRAKAEADRREFVRIAGSLALIRDLLNGVWSPADVLTIPPGHKVAGVYDWDQIVRSTPS